MLSPIFHDPLVNGALHDTFCLFRTPFVVYTSMNPIGFKISNLNKFVNNVDMRLFLGDRFTSPCECKGSPFLYKDHNQIKTGHLKTIDYIKLHKLFSKSSKYCENRTTDYQKAKESIIYGIKLCIQSWLDKHSVITSSFSDSSN